MIEELKFREKELRRVRNKLYDKDFKERSCEDSDSEEKIKTIKCEESKAEVDEDEDEFSKQDIKTIVNENAMLYQQIMLLSGQLAPIMDRIGRLYTDFSPHLLSSVSSFNSDMRNREHRTNRNRRSRRHNRDRRRNRSEDNSRQSDEELGDAGSNSSDSLSRDSNDSNNRGSGDDRADRTGNNEIRSRLRSISNTISRIRSSISSMRTLIFNNLGRGEHGEDGSQNRFGIDERGERQIIVNPQVPIISSPGDIASVHNIFDRFIDRQMVNVIGNDGNPSNRQNRNNQNQSNQNNSNEPNERSNNETENNNANNRNRRSNANNQRQGDLLSQLVGDAGPLGFLNSEFGGSGFGGGSETIEFHIHAFVPSGSRDENPIQRNILNSLNAQLSNENSNQRNSGSNTEESHGEQNNRVRQQSNRDNQASENVEPNRERSITFEDREIQTIEIRSRRGRRSRNRERDDKELSAQSANSSINLGYRNPSPSSFIRREVDENEILKLEFCCQTEPQTNDVQIQNSVNMYEKWTQTKENISLQMNEKAIISNSNGVNSEMRSEISSTKNKSRVRETSSRLKKK